MRPVPIILLALSLCLCGCSALGPPTVARDRFDYNTAIADSWKEQTLLNIVKIRYADMPLFIEVASIVNGYSLEGTVSLAGNEAPNGSFLFGLGSSAKYTDRPTITYSPITGQNFNKSFMTPIPPNAVIFLMQSGWPAELIMKLTVDAMNGLRSQRGGLNTHNGDSRFYRVIELLGEVQKSGAVGMQIVKEGSEKETTLMLFYRENVSQEVVDKMKEINELLGLETGAREIQINYGLIARHDKEFAMLTRSLLHIMVQLALQVDVPAEHVTDGRTVPSLFQKTTDNIKRRRLINIQHSTEQPPNAFTAVRYRDYWFWIDDRDFQSKRTFTFLMVLFSLMETGGREGLPLVTIPAS